jgi:hypothetical protein
MIFMGFYSPMRGALSNKWLPRISRIPLLISLPAILAILASVLEVSMLLMDMDSPMAVASVVPFLADLVPHLVEGDVAITSIIMLRTSPISSVRSCYQRFDQSSQHDSQSPLQAFYSSPRLPTNDSWYPDTRATHHFISDLYNLNLTFDAYKGSGEIRVGNGIGLSVNHFGSTLISSPH